MSLTSLRYTMSPTSGIRLMSGSPPCLMKCLVLRSTVAPLMWVGPYLHAPRGFVTKADHSRKILPLKLRVQWTMNGVLFERRLFVSAFSPCVLFPLSLPLTLPLSPRPPFRPRIPVLFSADAEAVVCRNSASRLASSALSYRRGLLLHSSPLKASQSNHLHIIFCAKLFVSVFVIAYSLYSP